MRLGRIVLRLRLAETRFENRIAGAAELALALKGTLTKAPTAFCIQLAETASPNRLDNEVDQELTETFAVVTALDNATTDKGKTGLIAYDSLFAIRAEIFRALLGWQIEGAEDYPISYNGGRILGITRATLWYQFEFTAKSRISQQDDGVDVIAEGLEAGTLTDFDKIYAQWALIGPHGREFVDWEDFFGPGAFPGGFGPGFDVHALEPLDMGSIVDFTEDSRDGAFGPGFGVRFEVSEH